MKIKFYIIFLLFLTSCQYKYPGHWLYEIYPAHWRHEFNSKLSECDDEKLLFIQEYIDKYPDVDSSFFNRGNLLITNEEYKWIEQNKNLDFKTKLMNEFKDKYEVVVNYKSKSTIKSGEVIIEHNIGIEHYGSSLEPYMAFLWEYDKKRNKWLLRTCYIMTNRGGNNYW